MSMKLLNRMLTKAAILALAVLTSAVTAVNAATFEIQPHRAIYKMELASLEDNSTVVHARGQFDFEWVDACDAWTVSQRALLEIGHSDGRVINFGWSYSAWEQKDGLAYRFFITRRFGSDQKEEVRGEAHLDGRGKGGLARFLSPTEREVELPEGTLFPSNHVLDLLGALEEDRVPPWRALFDGSGDNGIHGVSAAVARSIPPGEMPGFRSPLTDEKASWTILLAFFDLDESGSLPEQEQTFRLYENGVVDQLTFDYGDFSVKAVLEELEALSNDGC